MSLIIFFSAFISALYYILMPLFNKAGASTFAIPEDADYSRLLDQKNTIFTALKDLDFEFAMGKLSRDDFERLRTELKQDAAQVMTDMSHCEGWIETQLQSRRANLFPSCQSCKTRVPSNAKFCPQCGAAL